MNHQMIHKQWLADSTTSCEEHHSEFIWISNAMKAFCSQSFDWIESTFEIYLPIPAQTLYHKKFNLARQVDNTRMLYVHLKVVDEHYSVREDKYSFGFL